MKRFVFSVIAVLSMMGTASYAQSRLSDEVAYKIKSEGFSNSKIEELSQFMTDEMGPRLAASQLKLRAEAMVISISHEMNFVYLFAGKMLQKAIMVVTMAAQKSISGFVVPKMRSANGVSPTAEPTTITASSAVESHCRHLFTCC